MEGGIFKIRTNFSLEYLNWPKDAFDPELKSEKGVFKVDLKVTNFRILFEPKDYILNLKQSP